MNETLVTAWDETTGQKLSYQVPRRFIGHPVFGPHLTDIDPTQERAGFDNSDDNFSLPEEGNQE